MIQSARFGARRRWGLAHVVALAALAGTVELSAAAAASAETIECLAPVRAFSNPDKAARGDVSANALFSEVELRATSVGYGAAGGRSDEITVADGRLYLVRPDGLGGVRTRHKADAGEGAFMLQEASPLAWSNSSALVGVSSVDDLGRRLDEAVRAAGCEDGARLAFRIEGRVTSATWSLDTLPARAEFTTLGAPALIVGIYTTMDAARHAMPAGRNFHAHIVFPAADAAGHLRSLVLENGAQLKLQLR